MPRFSEYFSLNKAQAELDFVNVNSEQDTPVFVDPYAIEIRNDVWSEKASSALRGFFEHLLAVLRAGDKDRAIHLTSHLMEPKETFLGVSKTGKRGRGVGSGQAYQLINAVEASEAFKTGLLTDISDMALYVEGVDRDKISDLTTNIIRKLLVEYTRSQCNLHNIMMKSYASPPFWDPSIMDWRPDYVLLPYMNNDPVILIPKYIVRRKLSLDSQEFYNGKITDFLMGEQSRGTTSLARALKNGQRKITKKEVREKYPKSKKFITNMVAVHPELLKSYKAFAKIRPTLATFEENKDLSVYTICNNLADELANISTGVDDAEVYHKFINGALTALFYPDLIIPSMEWEINDGRKRIDIVYTNAADRGFFAQRRDDAKVNANLVIVECKNYTNDIVNPEIDQLLGRFDDNRGKFGILACRDVDKLDLLNERLRDAARSSRGYIICLTDRDIISMLREKAKLNDEHLEKFLYEKYRILLG